MTQPQNLGYTGAASKEVGLKSPRYSGCRTRQSMRHFYARAIYGRGCDGYNTRKGKKSAWLYPGFEPPAASMVALKTLRGGFESLVQERSMSQSAPAFVPTLAVVNGIPTTTSIDVARHFGKRHDDVLRAIRNLLSQMPEEYRRNFAEVPMEYTNGMGGTQTAPAYRITRDGFTLLAMGFTGKKALAFKLAYIDAFNTMEAQMQSHALITNERTQERIRRAQATASEVAAQVSQAIFDAVMNDTEAAWFDRWMFAWNRQGPGMHRDGAWVSRLGMDASVVYPHELAQRIEADGLDLSAEQLLAVIHAASNRLNRHVVKPTAPTNQPPLGRNANGGLLA